MTSLPTFLHSVYRYFGSSYFQRCTVDHVDCKALQTLLQSMRKTRDPGGFYLHQNFGYKATTYPAHMHRTSRHFQRSPFKCAHITEHRSRFPVTSHASSRIPSLCPKVPECPINCSPNKQPLDQ